MSKYPVSYALFPVAPSLAFPQGRVARRPILQIALVNGQLRLSCYAIVDSGADHCVFPSSFMAPLGLSPLSGRVEPSFGVGGLGFAHFHNIALDLQGAVQFRIYAAFTDGLEQWGVGLLGQNGFFDRLNVSFNLRAGIFEIET